MLESLDFRVALDPGLTARKGYLAGPDEARAEALNKALADPDVRGVFCARGGYGSSRILGLIDYAAVRDDPKVFVGYSDITALHLALAREAGLVTFHGPGVESLGEKLTRFTLDCLVRAVTSTDPLDVLPLPEDRPAGEVLSAGRASGPLTGGNLSLLSALMGTPYEVDTRGAVLLIEDVREEPYRVDRMLTQLTLAGKLASAAAVAVGEMVDCTTGRGRPEPGSPEGGGRAPYEDEAETPTGDEAGDLVSVDDVLADRLAGLGRPVLGGLPFGHGYDKWTLPLGVTATVDAYKARLIVEEAACAGDGS